MGTWKDIQEAGKGKASASFSFLALSFFVSSQSAFSIVGLPLLLEQGEVAHSQLAWLLGIHPFAAAIVAITAGPASDLYGRRNLLVVGQLGFAIALILHVFASSFEMLMALRFAAGAFSGLLLGLPSIFASDNYERPSLQHIISRNLLGYSLGHMAGIPLGIFLLQYTSFQHLTTCIGIVAITTFPIISRSLPKCHARKRLGNENFLGHLLKPLKSKEVPQAKAIVIISFSNFFASALFQVSITMWLVQHKGYGAENIAPMFFAAGFLQSLIFLFATPNLHYLPLRTIIAVSFAANSMLFLLGSAAFVSTVFVYILFCLALGVAAFRIPAWHAIIATQGQESSKGLRMSLSQTAGLLGKASGAAAASALFTHIHVASFCVFSASLLFFCAAFLIKNRGFNGGSNQNSTQLPCPFHGLSSIRTHN